MKLKTILFAFIFPLFLGAQDVKLPSVWKFQIGDDMRYKEKSFDDSVWENIKVPGYWEHQGWADYTGIGWYRVGIKIPDNLMGQDLMLELGQVDDTDETYFNGELIGSTGKFPPNPQASHSQFRKYKIPKHLLKSENVIAVRVLDLSGEGGICCNSNMTIYPYSEYESRLAKIRSNKNSYHQLTTSNGLISAVYNAKNDIVENIYPHAFVFIDSGVVVQTTLRELKINRKDKPISVRYKDNTHVIEVKYKDLTVNYFASYVNQDKVFYAEIIGEKPIINKLKFTYKTANGSHTLKPASFKKGANLNTYYLELIVDYSFDSESDKNNNLCADEVSFMRKVIDKSKIPSNLSKDERDLFEQSISIMKMSQVSDKEIYPKSHGQVMASLRPGSWAICWVRDGAYALMAMSRIGMYDEARKGLEFMLKADANRFRNYIYTDGLDYGPDVDYQISLTRYFGNGKEECDFNDFGPNIEYDDWGLFLMALDEYVRESNDWDFYKKWRSVICSKVGDAIIHVIQPNGLLKRDSGPWEHHLPGNQYTFTNGVNSVGLKKLAALEKHIGEDGSKYEKASKTIYDGVMEHLLIDGKFLKGNHLEKDPSDHRFYDASTFEMFASDFIGDESVFRSHMSIYDTQLRVNLRFGKDRGYIRINSHDSYENQEWPFASLRVAVAQIKFGTPEKAKPLIDRITDYAKHNYNIIPEILTNEDVQYDGSIPMVGYGAGAYIIAISDYYKVR